MTNERSLLAEALSEFERDSFVVFENVIESELVSELRERLLKLRSTAGSDAPLLRADPELIRSLEALGYLPEEEAPPEAGEAALAH